ncbi:hypothetical protein [Microbacterium oleivorans]|uniref:Uncharacterized protein n=1 Tax=Microbacterium oleivorans TaxID=273677 RepID=A0A4R5YJZ2_9MICO|nr:hypothetical protein [Microbacterium oleivorans]TDL45289.1 hypothetical protein E2R54_02155 [Microbacterium oleivorans]
MTSQNYERTTQFVPATLTLVPLSVLVIVAFDSDDLATTIRSIVTASLAAGLHLVIMRIVRDRGNKVQPQLWESWGGNPAESKLRWGHGSDDDTRLLHSRVRAATGVKLPTRSQQDARPDQASAAYSEAVANLRERTRDHDAYPRVWSELLQYGSARNLYAVRPIAFIIAGGASVTGIGLAILSALNEWDKPSWLFAATAGFSLLWALGWAAAVTPRYVRTAADRYADALLSASRSLGSR